MSDSEKRFLLRISEELYAEVEAWASEDMRSVNAQIVTILRAAVARRKAERGQSDEKTPEEIETPEPIAA